MKTKLLITGLALMALTTFASGQTQGPRQRLNNQNGKECTLTDANNDGICDNYELRKPTLNRGNGQGNGKGKGQGRKQSMCNCGKTGNQCNQNGPVDADKNGICDFREASSKK